MESNLRPRDPRPIRVIAQEICRIWKNVYFAAKPYLAAMTVIDTIDEKYFNDSGEEIVLRFLSNAQHFRGADARRIKKELQLHLNHQGDIYRDQKEN